MRNISGLFGRSPFHPIVAHARKVHECVQLVRPIAESVLQREKGRLMELQHQMSKTEYEADLLKDRIRQALPHRYFLPVSREDVLRLVRALDRIADAAEDFAVVATLRVIELPEDLHQDFLALVDKVVGVSESLLDVTEHLAELQKEAFVGVEVEDVLAKIRGVCEMEWESDKLSRRFARRYYAVPDLDVVAIMILDKLCGRLNEIADHAENVGKALILMISRK
ncbi:MAG TPA: TIGR00153 family protein [Phycisphaerae bacterium]|nr:TIGR00153 family protein [Phycisphaerae bacterium]